MTTLVYLDQNILSDLRERKLLENRNDELLKLKHILKSEQFATVYSHVTLEEILQINNQNHLEFKKEHIDLLTDLSAFYIHPTSRELVSKKPKFIWDEYLGIKKENYAMGIDSLLNAYQLFSRKISGLKIEDSFEEINCKIKKSLHDLMDSCEAILSIDDIKIDAIQKKSCELQIIEFRNQINSLQHLNIENNETLGPIPFRETPEIRRINFERLEVESVVHRIEEIFHTYNNNSTMPLIEKNIQSDIARAYSLMNWAGYYADDFTSKNTKKDRFNASSKDMQHVIESINSDFLISNDKRFKNKAQACFAYAGVKTIVCGTREFIENTTS